MRTTAHTFSCGKNRHMGDTTKTEATTAADLPRCEVRSVRGGISYRCALPAGHAREHEAVADEYCHRTPDWQALFAEAVPLLEWVARNPATDHARVEAARRLLVQHYLAVTRRPGLARPPAP
jgi:hypothetical protein